MDKKRIFSATEDAFGDSIPETDEALYCNPLDGENDTGEKRFCPKNKEKTKNNEKKRDNSTFF